MIRQEFKGTITVRCFCEVCEVEYMALSDDEACPVCVFNKQQEAKKAAVAAAVNKKTKGGGKDA